MSKLANTVHGLVDWAIGECVEEETEIDSKRVWCETWNSDSSEEERHYFIYDTDIYVFGFNPKLVSADDVHTILTSLGYTIEGARDRAEQRESEEI